MAEDVAGGERSGRVRRLRASLRDERGGRAVLLSHCLLDENTRYLGGAFRSGAVVEVVEPYLRDGTGICQMPCPEQVVWGGALKRHLLRLYGRPTLAPVVVALLPLMAAYTRFRYRLLARRVAKEVADLASSGVDVVGVIGVGTSPSCGVTTTLDMRRSLQAVCARRLDAIDRRFVNEEVVGACVRPGRGMFTDALDHALGRRGLQVPLLEHDLRTEMPPAQRP